MQSSSTHRQFVTVPEALQILRVGRTRFYELLNAGELSAVRLGRRTLVRADEIDRFIHTLEAYQPRSQRRELVNGRDRLQQLKLNKREFHD